MIDNFTRLKSSIGVEIISHLHLLHMEGKSFREYLSSPYRIILICIFTVLFFPHVFVVVKPMDLAMAYEVDPGSIIGSILSLYQNPYNMNMGYHSSFYGWTYYAINFFLLAPIYAAQKLKIVSDDYFFFLAGLRFIFFMIGLSSILVYFEVAKRIFKQTFLSFIAVLLLIAANSVSTYFYFLHPESTGLLFLFLGILCLLRFNDGAGEDYRWYTYGLLCLVLSALSKQIFFVTALPVIFLFYYLYCYHHTISILKFATSRQFARMLLWTIFISIFVFFTINPFAFFQPKLFISNQTMVVSNQMFHTNLSFMEGVRLWLETIKTMPIIFISLILFPFTLLGVMIFGFDQKIGGIFYIVNILGCFLFIIIFTISSRFIISATYFAPIYPFFVLNFLSTPLYIIRKWNVTALKFLISIPLAYFLFFLLVTDFSQSIRVNYARLMYKDSLIYEVYGFIEERIPDGARITYDQFVALPSNKELIGCHYWSKCSTDYIEDFQPDYVIFNEDFTFNGEHLPTVHLRKYVRDHHYFLIDTIESPATPNSGPITISVWMKVNP